MTWLHHLLPVGVIAASFVLGLLLRWIVGRSRPAMSRLDDRTVSGLRRWVLIWCVLGGIWVAADLSTLPPSTVKALREGDLILLMLSGTFIGAHLLAVAATSRLPGAGRPASSLTRHLIKAVVIIVGLLVILNVFGIPVTPLLTALGVGGLAVALALEDTLKNFFAGLYTGLSRQVRLGDVIKLESGEEGYVADMTWRSTTIRTLNGNLVIVPNRRLAEAIVTNFSLPDRAMGVAVEVEVALDSDPELVERVLLEVTKKAHAEIAGFVSDFEPAVRMTTGPGPASLRYSVFGRVMRYEDQGLALHELRKRILLRFRKEGIVIPSVVMEVRQRQPPARSG
ncbi:MAG TPA: mechanosensitive ion channel family protein [Planctomycetota bacterium]|nr:mechanosensitive ion channel family protein [Planctomycetota bacterium]